MSARMHMALIMAACCLSTGCAAVTMENTSPVKTIPAVEPFQVIQGTILVKPSKPGDLVQNDVAKALRKEDVFTNATTALAAGEKPLVELVVTHEDDSTSHFGVEMLKAVLIGITLYALNPVFADNHDYTVTVNATLTKEGKELAKYSVTGSYHSEIPESRTIVAKVEHTKKNVKLSWEHALGLLVAAIKQDRAKIVGQ